MVKRTWRYGCRKQKHITVMPDGKRHQETQYEVIEVHLRGDEVCGWSADGVTIHANNKKSLAAWLRKAAEDVEKHAAVNEAAVVTHLGRGKE